MGLLNDVKAAVKADTKEAATPVADSKAERKARAKERKAAKAAALQKVLDYLAKNPVKELDDAVKTLTVKAAPIISQGLTVEQLFGDKTSISALDVFTKFKKGYPEMRKYIKKWAEKGITVTLDPATQSYTWKK
jgi:hypothetical protein